jgi:YggT family protein
VLETIIWATSTVLTFLIIARALASWFIRNPYNPVMEFLIGTTEPILGPIRSVMPRGMMFDFSPIIAIIIIRVISEILLNNV